MDGPETKGPLSRRDACMDVGARATQDAVAERDRERESKNLLARARTLRRQSSDAESVLWQHLRAHRLLGYKFRRQVVIEPYIVDFVCLEARLIIEADGGQHSNQATYDTRRTAVLEGMGYRVMRFWNHEVLCELQSVLEQIRTALIEAPSPHPFMPFMVLPQGEGVRATPTHRFS